MDGTDWELSLSAGSFDTCLSRENEWLTVWEDSAERLYDRSQHIQIQSALVDPAQQRALAAALQTAQSYHDFCLPSSDNDDHHQRARLPPIGMDLSAVQAQRPRRI